MAITLAGAWCVLLVVFRMFDQPDDAGIQWGLFGAFVAAGRADRRGRADPRRCTRPSRRTPPPTTPGWVHAPRRERERTPDRQPRDATAVTEFLRDRPAWEGEPRDAPTTRWTKRPPPACRTPRRRPPRRERATRPTERLWDDEPPAKVSLRSADEGGEMNSSAASLYQIDERGLDCAATTWA